jgi:hypothetical protein
MTKVQRFYYKDTLEVNVEVNRCTKRGEQFLVVRKPTEGLRDIRYACLMLNSTAIAYT